MVDIPDAHVFPEDIGTDAPSTYKQADSAGFFGGMIRRESTLNVVETGLDFNPDYGNNSVDITGGLAFLLVDDTIQVQQEPGGDHSESWRSGIGIVVDVPEVLNISLTNGATNHVFLAVDMTAGDGAYYEVNTTDEQPTDPYVKLGTIDTVNETYDIENRTGGTDADLDNHVTDFDNPHNVTNDQVGAPSQSEFDALDDDVYSLDLDVSSLQTDVSTLETDLSDHKSNGDHAELSGDVVNRSDPITHLEGNTWHLHVNEPVPDEAGPGDEILWYE